MSRTLIALTFVLASCGGTQAVPSDPAPAPADESSEVSPEITAPSRVTLRAISVVTPPTWTAKDPSSKMRLAEWAMGDEPLAAELVAYFFPGGAGTLEANLTRWYGQFEQADGSPTESVAKTDNKTIAGLTVTTVDVSGRYVAAVRPGAAEKNDKPGYRMLAAIVETEDGNYYFKLLGPEATVAANAPQFDALLQSIQAE